MPHSCSVSPNSGRFSGNNVRLGSRGDSYYEYLLKIWLQTDMKEDMYRDMYREAMEGVHKHLVATTPQGLVRTLSLPLASDPVLAGVCRRAAPRRWAWRGLAQDGPSGVLPWRQPGSGRNARTHTEGGGGEVRLAVQGTRRPAHCCACRGLLTDRDRKDLKLAEDLTYTCWQMYERMASGLAPEIAFFRYPKGGRSESGCCSAQRTPSCCCCKLSRP